MKKYFTRERVRFYILGFLALSFFTTTSIYSLRTKDVNELWFTGDDGTVIDFDDGWLDEESFLKMLPFICKQHK